jgi:hypothetical protein
MICPPAALPNAAVQAATSMWVDFPVARAGPRGNRARQHHACGRCAGPHRAAGSVTPSAFTAGRQLSLGLRCYRRDAVIQLPRQLGQGVLGQGVRREVHDAGVKRSVPIVHLMHDGYRDKVLMWSCARPRGPRGSPPHVRRRARMRPPCRRSGSALHRRVRTAR